MKLNRILLLILFSIFLSGCDVTYTIDLDRKYNVDEFMIVNATNDEDISNFKKFNWNIPRDNKKFEVSSLKKPGITYYNIKKNDKEITFKNHFSNDNYIRSTIVHHAYDYVSFAKIKGKMIIASSPDFLLFEEYENLDNVRIIINSSQELIETNADEVEFHKYIWNINKDNARNHMIYLVLNSKDDRTFWEKVLDGDYTNVFSVFILLFLIGGCILFFIHGKGVIKNKV